MKFFLRGSITVSILLASALCFAKLTDATDKTEIKKNKTQEAGGDGACLAWLRSRNSSGRIQVLQEYDTLMMYAPKSAAGHLRLICSHIYDRGVIGSNQNTEIENVIALIRDENFDAATEKLHKILGGRNVEKIRQALIEISKSMPKDSTGVKAAELKANPQGAK